MEEYAIVAEGITKVYGGKLTAVDHVDLRVKKGGIFGLLGPNGAGKTTIIKLLTGLSDLTAGRASVAGFDVTKEPMMVKQRIGWVAAEVILDDDLSAWENLWLQAKLQRMSDWKQRAQDLLSFFELFDRRSERVGGYSTGMRKKLEIALALLHAPEVIFMDEPTIGLDASTRRMLWELITGVNKQFGATVLLTTHYMEEADTLCDRVAIIETGRFVAEGSPAELKARVHSDFVEFESTEELTPERLQAIAGVEEVKTQGKAWILKVSSAETALPNILNSLDPKKIHHMNVDKPSLETVYLSITGKRLDKDTSGVQDSRKFYAQLMRARR